MMRTTIKRTGMGQIGMGLAVMVAAAWCGVAAANVTKLLDFGLARMETNPPAAPSDDGSTFTQHTMIGTVMGTTNYMSPEQVRGLPADARSDVFSFGAVLYEMITGRRPFQRETPADTMAAILKDSPPPLSEVTVAALPPPSGGGRCPSPTSFTNASKKIRTSDSPRPKSWPTPCAL